jgi:predicted RNA-binding protein
MCEFSVVLNGKVLFKDVVFAKAEGNKVTTRNVLGETREFADCVIGEIDENSGKLVLVSTAP